MKKIRFDILFLNLLPSVSHITHHGTLVTKGFMLKITTEQIEKLSLYEYNTI